ncbi:hypothetical protein H2200_002019 [Cladophialophora chaetospira]|uniref:Transcription factor domain-containing protein n=1 Tax=Cladophialophora chaetospira TaxID=386627 RepID=A0AA39CN33_9EURO|nr:hypothetical protein H2200_002019 [Cladophialophora chaetospira]
MFPKLVFSVVSANSSARVNVHVNVAVSGDYPVNSHKRWSISELKRTESASISTSVEHRLSRLEAKIDALVSPQREPSVRSDEAAESPFEAAEDFQGDTTFEAPLSALNANLESVKAQLGLGDWTADPITSPSTRSDLPDAQITGPFSPWSASTRGVRVGAQFLPFPSPADYQKYIDFFFDDINPCHSCVNEADFRHKNRNLARGAFARNDDICFLALNYIIFACADILRNVDPIPSSRSALCPGWNWFLASDALLRKRKLSGKASLCLIQFLIYEAFYLVHADRSSAAYSAIGIAYSDIHVEKPEWIYDKMLSPSNPFPPPDPEKSAIMYLICMISFGNLAGVVWDTVFSASVDGPSPEAIAILDARIKYWTDNTLPTIPLLPRHTSPTRRHLRQQLLVKTRISHLRLLLHRREMVSLNYSTSTGLTCGALATNIIEQLKAHRDEISEPSSFRFHLATTLGGAILVLATLLCRDLTEVNLMSHHAEYAESFHAAANMLEDLSRVLRAARRIADDLESILTSVKSILLRSSVLPQSDTADFTPSAFNNIFDYTNPGFTPQDQFPENNAANVTADGGIASFNYDIFASLDTWDSYFQSTSNESGVPWI